MIFQKIISFILIQNVEQSVKDNMMLIFICTLT